MGPSSSSSLPITATSFVGRAEQVEELRGLVSEPGLVTLVGAPGVGKTRLALEVVRGAAKRRTCYWVDLAPLLPPGLVAEALVAELGLHERAGVSPEETVVAGLGAASALVVLDSCEHVLDACGGMVRTILEDCPRVTVVATSREPLAVVNERVWPVEPMPTVDAVRLFYARAEANQVGFAVGDDVAAAVVDICARLEGIPLAVELAAGRVAMLAPSEIASHLASDPLALLSRDGRVGTTPRHQTLRAALDWSFTLLSPAEQTLLRRLSAFSGGWTMAAAERVCGVEDVSKLMSALVAKSLVVARGDDRHDLLATVRTYASERLAESGETADVMRRHGEWCVGIAEATEPELTGSNQLRAFERVDAELGNLRAGFNRALERGGDDALRIAGALTVWWRVRGRFGEGRRWLDAALGRATASSSHLRVKALWGAGFLAHMVGDDPAAHALLGKSLDDARQLSDQPGEARAILLLANLDMSDDALAVLQESASLASAAGDHWCQAHALALVGSVHLRGARLHDAQQVLEEGVAVARDNGDLQGLRMNLQLLAEVVMLRGDCAKAEELGTETLGIVRALDDPYGMAWALKLLGELAFLGGDHKQAGSLLDECVVNARRAGSANDMALAMCGLGYVLLAQGLSAEARGRFEAAWRMKGQPSSQVLRGLGRVAAQQGDLDGAGRHFDHAVAVAVADDNRGAAAAALCDLASIAAEGGQLDRAIALWRRALGLLWELGLSKHVAELVEVLGVAATEAGGSRQAARLLAASQAIHATNGYRRPASARSKVDASVSTLRGRLGQRTSKPRGPRAWRCRRNRRC